MAHRLSKTEKALTWPEIKLKTNLAAKKLKGSHLFTVSDFLSPAECEAFIKSAESRGFGHQGSLGPKHGEAFRDNDRISVHDTILAEKIWKAGLCNFFLDIKVQGKSAVGLNPNIRFYKYKVGQRFGQHIDESVDLGGGNKTEYTLLIYLSGGVRCKGNKIQGSKHNSSEQHLVGGETVFYAPRKGIVAEVVPIAGMALFHIHGDECMLHEARVVSNDDMGDEEGDAR
ncbi:hypothetical protein SUGI_0496790 [Cryptomeria japonica]|nr:hypothetical protein SUGI_0496790 [Cryptomeria japonica]